MTQLNSTFGKEPFDNRQTPFIWEGPKGSKVTVWVGEHYHQGNWLALEPHPEEAIDEAIKRTKKSSPNI